MNDDSTTAFARGTDPSTSTEAANSVKGGRLETLVLETMATMPDGATSEELAEVTGIERVTISPRLRPLANKGKIVETSERRLGKSGRKSIVWRRVLPTPQQQELIIP